MNSFKFLSKEKINKLPKDSGVYCFKAGRKIIYIGKANNLKERVNNHFQQPAYRDNLFINQISKVGYLKTGSEIEALILEARLIKEYQPKYNVLWRDDKNYFYIVKTKEDFPKILITHQPPKRSEYVGPFVDGKALKETLKFLRRAFPFRSCNKLPKRPCLWYQLQRCPAPCLLKKKMSEQIPNLKIEINKTSQKNAKNIMKILRGEEGQVFRSLKKDMKNFSKIRKFEKAAKIRDKIIYLEKVLAHSKVFGPSEVVQEKNWLKTQRILQKILNFKKDISRIEAYDISNIQGKSATGSMITFTNGLPNKDFYRKFRIKIQGKPNDIAMIKEILNRRFYHLEWRLPDLILIDGGRAQLNVAVNSRLQNLNSKKIKILALAKKKNELFIEGKKKPILLKNLPREIFNLILQLRDEAHRFARKYHLKLREIDLGLK
jgi:excinuclease ABC subunit C